MSLVLDLPGTMIRLVEGFRYHPSPSSPRSISSLRLAAPMQGELLSLMIDSHPMAPNRLRQLQIGIHADCTSAVARW
jgi:hypothetical protein